MQNHEYSVIGHSRSSIGRYLAMTTFIIISLLPAAGILFSDFMKELGLPELGKYFITIPITAGVVYIAIHWIFNNALWRVLCLISKVPYIAGDWHCEGKSLNEDGEVIHKWEATLTISQTWEKIQITLKTKNSESHSNSAALIQKGNNSWMLMHSYSNKPKNSRPDLNAHQGYMETSFDKYLNSAEGEYFTARSRGTIGSVTLTRIAS